MRILCTLASIASPRGALSTAALSRSLHSTNFSTLTGLGSLSSKPSMAMQASRLSGFSKVCVQFQPAMVGTQCGLFTVHRCFTNSHLPYNGMKKVQQPLALCGSLLRMRGAAWNEVLERRLFSEDSKKRESYQRRTALIYVCAAGIFMLGMSYAGVPLYRLFCQATGLGGTVSRGHDTSKIETMEAVPERAITVRFNADVASSMRWNFKPQQIEVKVFPGETALAFYTAKNPTDKAIIGISTYNVVPFEAGQYFNKIQCFCFEEQRLNPHEQVDMPVFFYIDPEFVEDPKLQGVDMITLSYTFFEAKEGFHVPLPGYMTQAQ